jgi:hypothetical protein
MLWFSDKIRHVVVLREHRGDLANPLEHDMTADENDTTG